MASPRHLPSSALLVVLAGALAVVPGLFLFQGMVRRARQGQQRLVADLVVRLNDRVPHHLAVQLVEVPSAGRAGTHVRLDGQGRLRGGSFPWKEAPLAARLTLELPWSALTGPQPPLTLTTRGGQLSARYVEQLVGAAQEAPGVDCVGEIEVERFEAHAAEGAATWAQVRRFDGTLTLRCDGSGLDARAGTEDDVHFALVGTLAYHWDRTG